MLEILSASHLTRHVTSPFNQRGGIMLVGPPATLKTTFIEAAFEDFPDAIIMSDINIQTLIRMRTDLKTGRYSTFAFTEIEKLYRRSSSTASNLEGSIAMLVEEGFRKASFEDSRIQTASARCLVVGAMTDHFYEFKYQEWMDTGFLRRFLWCVINIENGHKLMDAISAWKRLDIGTVEMKSPGNRSIPYDITDAEDARLRIMVKHQPGEQTPFVLIKKIFCVLKWKYFKRDPRLPMDIMVDFSQSLKREGANIIL